MPPKTVRQPIDLKTVDATLLSDYKEVFSTFDRDGDGTIDASELGAVMASFGVNPSLAELNKMVEEVDLDNSGAIDFAEFVTMMQSRSNTSNPEDEATSVFHILDKDKDGFVSLTDLKAALVNIKWSNEPAPNDDDVKAMVEVKGSTAGKGINLDTFKKIVLAAMK